jgi:hypothetical protein
MKKSVKHPRRQELPANLPRVEWILPCTPDQRVCRRCVKETVVIGYEEKLPAYSEIFLLCGAATALTFFIADLLFLCALSASKTWERTLHPVRRPAFSSHLITALWGETGATTGTA